MAIYNIYKIHKIPYEPSFAVTSQNGLSYNTERIFKFGAHCGAVGWGTALQTGRLWVWFPMVSLEFFIHIILPAALRPWGRLTSNRNEYQEYFLGGKGGRWVGLTTLPPSRADCIEIWQPQPPGTLRACPGLCTRIVLPFYLTFQFFPQHGSRSESFIAH